MRKRFVATLILLFVVYLLVAAGRVLAQDNAAARQDSAPFVVIPFEYAPLLRSHIVVRASIDGSEPLLFLLDSGSEPGLIVFPWAAEKLKLKPTKLTQMMNNNVKLKVLEGGNFRFLSGNTPIDVRINIVKCLLMDYPATLSGYQSPKLAGIVGAEIMMLGPSCIDFDAKTWTLYGAPPSPPSGGERKAWQVPLSIRRDDMGIPISYVRLKVRDRDGKVLKESDVVVDTGSVITILPATTAFASLPKAVNGSVGVGFIGGATLQDFLAPSLSIAEASTKDVEVALRLADPNTAVGLNVLERFRVTFIPADSKMYLEERPGYTPRVLGITGLLLEKNRGTWRVKSIEERIKVKQEGDDPVRVGDRVLAIDGQDVTKYPTDFVPVLLNGYEGTPAILQVQTGSKPPRMVKVQRQSRYRTSKADAKQ